MKKKERERQEVLRPDTQPKIATVNIHPKKVALSESAKLTKFLHSLSPVFDFAIITRWENVSDLGEKCMFRPRSSKDGTWFNLGSPLETKRFTPKAIFKLPQIFQKW